MWAHRRRLEELRKDPATSDWARRLLQVLEKGFEPSVNGHLPNWLKAFQELPHAQPRQVQFDTPAVSALGQLEDDLEAVLRVFMPWRKGPFHLYGVDLDCEWRSDLKWERLAPYVGFEGKEILDVGCGNGYYGWRMLGAGARRVLGLEPFLLYLMQFEVLNHLLGDEPRNTVLLGCDEDIPKGLRAFDMVMSMGVLYHRKSPIDHLQLLRRALRPGGELVLETLILEGGGGRVLVPETRYAQMRNVWFIPTLELLERWLSRCGYHRIEVLDQTPTSPQEQRSTPWMTYHSLKEALDPADPTRTIEGYQAPLRALLKAEVTT